MNGYEKLLNVMRTVTQENGTPQIEIGTYKDGGIFTNNILIPSSMCYKLELATKRIATVVNGQVESGGAGDEAHTHGWTDKSTYIEPITDGDLIAYQKINDTKFLIIGRVV